MLEYWYTCLLSCQHQRSFQGEHMSERDSFTLRLKPDLLRFVREAAEEENRSIPNFVETVLLAEKRRRANQSKPPVNEC